MTFAQDIRSVRLERGKAINLSGRPAHFDIFNLRCATESKMQTGVTRRLIASATHALGEQVPIVRSHSNPGANAVTIGSRTFKLDRKPVTRGIGTIRKHDQPFVLGGHNRIDAAVIIEVADGKCSTEM